MPGWSAFAESAEAAVGVESLGLVWPGTEPKASEGSLAALVVINFFVGFPNQPLLKIGDGHSHPIVGG